MSSETGFEKKLYCTYFSNGTYKPYAFISLEFFILIYSCSSFGNYVPLCVILKLAV